MCWIRLADNCLANCLQVETHSVDLDRLNEAHPIPANLLDTAAHALASLRSAADFCWLTFFLRLPSEQTHAFLSVLESIGVEPDKDAAARCIYGKAKIGRDAAEICRLIDRVNSACANDGARMIAIDLDETPDERQRAVINLYCTP